MNITKFLTNLKWNEKGFTLLEVMIALLLIIVGIFLVSQVIAFSVNAGKISKLRLEMLQVLESSKNRVLSQPFTSQRLIAGDSLERQGDLTVKQCVTDIDPTLKKIVITVIYKSFSKRIYCYKSKSIKEVNHD